MAISENYTIWLPDEKSTRSAGASLATTLYRTDITIGIVGPLGAGKTTLLQGFFMALGVQDFVTSPTYALEQKYASSIGDIVHIDLYRLEGKNTDEFLLESDEHTGLRCIEWSNMSTIQPDILITLSDEQDGRTLQIDFFDIRLPTEKQILAWREQVELPDPICKHCDAVANTALEFADLLMQRGIVVRKDLVKKSALVHDLLRFVDFVPGAAHTPLEVEEPAQWQEWRDRYKGKKHEPACADFLRTQGYPELASVVAVHGLTLPSPDRTTIEQKLLYYADKRTMQDQRVTLDERFEDFKKRYASKEKTDEAKIWLNEAKRIEKELQL